MALGRIRGTNLFPDISGKVSGHERVSKKLAFVSEALISPLVVVRIENILLKRTKNRFITKRDPKGIPWAPLAAATEQRRKRALKAGSKGPISAFALAHGGILVQTGRLHDSIRVLHGPSRGFTATNTGGGFRIGTNHPAARLHQFGNKKKGVPVRRFLGTGIKDSQAIEALMLRVARTLGFRR